MKISQVLEQQQLDELDLKQAGSAVGSVAGKTLNAMGGVVGGVKGAWDAAKAGYQSGKAFVGGQRIGGGGGTDAKSINQAGPQGTAPAQSVQGTAGTAMANMGKAMGGQKPAQAGQTLYAQVKSQINNIDPQSKQKLLNLVQKSIQQKPKQGGAMAQMANALTGGGQQQPGQANTMANAPVSKTNTAQPGNPNAPAQQQQAPAQEPAQAPQQQASAPQAAPAAPAEQPAQQKMDPKKAAELKGRLKGGQGMAAQTGGGFKNYVAGSGERMTGVDASGGPVFKKIAREGYQFESKFLGGWI